jgi:membrane protein DedA with SNARE-associated domain
MQIIDSHATLVYFFLFAISFIEGIALLGAMIPGGTLLVLAGAFCITSNLHIALVIFAAVIGAFLGDYVSFIIGRKYKNKLEAKKFYQNSKIIAYGKDIFSKHDTKSIIYGRFIGFTRGVLPLMTGMHGMHKGKFASATFLGVSIWACAYILLGLIIGTSLHTIEKSTKIMSYSMLGAGVLFV